jgi:hypothetical protein
MVRVTVSNPFGGITILMVCTTGGSVSRINPAVNVLEALCPMFLIKNLTSLGPLGKQIEFGGEMGLTMSKSIGGIVLIQRRIVSFDVRASLLNKENTRKS